MLTTRNAATLLREASTPDGQRQLAQALGFSAGPVRLPLRTRRLLGIDRDIISARIASTDGPVRLLIAELAPDATERRSRIRRMATALTRHAPHHRWCLLLHEPSANRLLLATTVATDRALRLAVLQVDQTRIVDSDVETVRQLAALDRTEPLLWHARIGDVLTRDALSRRFYRALDEAVMRLADGLHRTPAVRGDRPRSAGAPSPAVRRELALVGMSRTLFLAFLERKGWLDGRQDFLQQEVTRAIREGRSLHAGLLRPLFFGALNTPWKHRAPEARAFGSLPFLNGGLFSPTPLERRWQSWVFSDDAITHLIGEVIDRYRFTPHEDSAQWSEAAVDPEMLGRAFEGLMAPADRKRTGAFFTPPSLVDAIVSDALAALGLPATPDAVRAQDDGDTDGYALLRERIGAVRALDPACGSGACLVHLLERLDQLLAAAGDERPAHERRRSLLATTLFGVDREPLAVWLCELRLWLAVVVSHPDGPDAQIPPLPNLDHQIRTGDALLGGTFAFAPHSARGLTRLRQRYAKAAGVRKQQLAETLDREERRRSQEECTRRREAVRTERQQLARTLRARDLFGVRSRPSAAVRRRLRELRTSQRAVQAELERLRHGGALPFRFGAVFADVAADGGFSLILGNPPWVRPHALAPALRIRLRDEFTTLRSPSWRTGAQRSGAGAGFAAQPDLAAAFIERSLDLLAPDGALALLVPAKLWRTLSGGGTRRLLTQQAMLHRLRDWSDAPPQFDAATYPSLLVATRRTRPAVDALALGDLQPDGRSEREAPVRITVVREQAREWQVTTDRLALAAEPDAPWILLPPDARHAFDTLRHAGPPLADSPLGRPRLGVKCGCNAAFLVHAVEHDDASATVSTVTGRDVRQGAIERHLLRPVLRGEEIGAPGPAEPFRLIWTHDARGEPLSVLPPDARRWLAHWRPALERRCDSRSVRQWWTLFRTEAARHDRPRVVWADIGRRLRATVLEAGDPTVPLNSCYVLPVRTSDEAWALHAILTSTLAAAWLDPLAEPARGRFRRYLGWTVGLLPIPHDWPAAVQRLAPLARAAGHQPPASRPVETATREAAVLASYGLTPSSLTPLLTWYAQ